MVKYLQDTVQQRKVSKAILEDKMEEANSISLDGVEIKFHERKDGVAIRKGGQILLSYVCCLENGGEVDKNTSFAVTCGVRDVVEGLDEALLMMQEGDNATVRISAEKGYGNASMPGIPINSPLVFHVQIQRVSNIPQTIDELQPHVQARNVSIADLLQEDITKRGALTVTKTYESVHAMDIAQEHLTLSALFQDYEDTFLSIIDDVISPSHPEFYSRALLNESFPVARIQSSFTTTDISFLCCKWRDDIIEFVVAAQECHVLVVIGDLLCVKEHFSLWNETHPNKLIIDEEISIAPGVTKLSCSYELSDSNSDSESRRRNFVLLSFSNWDMGSIPANNAWVKFWELYKTTVDEHRRHHPHTHIAVCEIFNHNNSTSSGDSSFEPLSRICCFIIIAACVASVNVSCDAASSEMIQNVNISQAYLDVSRCVRAAVTQSQYKFVYKAIRQAVKQIVS